MIFRDVRGDSERALVLLVHAVYRASLIAKDLLGQTATFVLAEENPGYTDEAATDPESVKDQFAEKRLDLWQSFIGAIPPGEE